MKFYLKLQPFSYFAIWLLWTFLFNHFGVFFHVLSASIGYDILSYFKFSTVIFVFALIIVFTFFLKPKGKKNRENIPKDS